MVNEAGRIARSLVEGQGFSSPFAIPTGPTAWMPPVYPCLLAAIFRVFGVNTFKSLLAAVMLNCIFAALTCVLVCWIGRRAFGEAAGLWAAWTWALLPALVRFPVIWIWETSLSALLMALIFWAALRLADSSRLRDWGTFGLLGGLAALTNPTVISAWLFLGAWAYFRRREHRQPWLKPASIALLLCVLPTVPWLVRNYIVFGQPVFLRSNFGIVLFLGNNPESVDSQAWWLNPTDNMKEMERFHSLGEIAYSAEKQRLAFEFMREHPRKFVALCLNRFVFFWLGTSDTLLDVWMGAPFLASLRVTAYALLALLAFVGLVLAGRAHSPYAAAFAIVLVIYPLVYYVTYPTIRFRHPIDPLLVVLSVWTIARAASALTGKKAD